MKIITHWSGAMEQKKLKTTGTKPSKRYTSYWGKTCSGEHPNALGASKTLSLRFRTHFTPKSGQDSSTYGFEMLEDPLTTSPPNTSPVSRQWLPESYKTATLESSASRWQISDSVCPQHVATDGNTLMINYSPLEWEGGWDRGGKRERVVCAIQTINPVIIL